MSGLEASLLLGSVHSVLLGIVLRRRERNRRANQYLAATLGALSVLLFDGFLRARGAHLAYPHLIGLAAWVPFVLGPLVFLYVREMTAPDPARPPPWRHFIITGAYLVLLAITFYPRSATFKREIGVHDVSWFVHAIEVGLLVYGTIYASASLVLLRRHRGHVQAIYSNLHGVSLRWLLVLGVMNALIWIGAFVGFVIRMTGVAEAEAASAIVPLGSTLLVFVIGYFQLGQSEIFVGQPIDVALGTSELPPPRAPSQPPATPRPAVTPAAPPPAPVPAPIPTTTPAPSEAAAPTATPPTTDAPPAAEPVAIPYARARLPEDDAAALEARIKAAMTDKHLYKRPGLTLSELADEVAATPHEVSQVLSTRLGRNFYNFVNEHRIEHVKAELLATERPVLDLAFEAGFQSKSTFNSAFRKATGTTPREFRQRSSH